VSTHARAPARQVALRRGSVIVVALVLIAQLAGCSQFVPGQAGAAPDSFRPTGVAAVTPLQKAPSALSSDEVATATATALQRFWRERFPADFGRPWTAISGFVPVRTKGSALSTPPCLQRAADIESQAFYCPSADIVAWDADGLIPELMDKYGPVGVVVALAHETGHAVHSRLGVDGSQTRVHPTILLEAMADCYAGVAIAAMVARPVPGLPVGLVERDTAMQALVGFRDPIGVDAGDLSAHGNAFDRVSAFQSGYTDGATRCAAMTVANQPFTQRRFGSADDQARGGDLPLPDLLDAVEKDARGWFSAVGSARTPGWQAPVLGRSLTCSGRAAAAQGPAVFCAADGSVSIDPSELAAVHEQFGDYAAGVLVAGRYGLATLDAAALSTVGPRAGAASTCLSGAYTGRLIDGSSFSLSPGDLDEAVQVLLAGDWAERDSGGQVDPADHGFDRVARFRAGLLNGPESCLPAG
jgi:predicted metalloprotease